MKCDFDQLRGGPAVGRLHDISRDIHIAMDCAVVFAVDVDLQLTVFRDERIGGRRHDFTPCLTMKGGVLFEAAGKQCQRIPVRQLVGAGEPAETVGRHRLDVFHYVGVRAADSDRRVVGSGLSTGSQGHQAEEG